MPNTVLTLETAGEADQSGDKQKADLCLYTAANQIPRFAAHHASAGGSSTLQENQTHLTERKHKETEAPNKNKQILTKTLKYMFSILDIL